MRDKDMERKLDVYLRNDLVGRLWLDEGRRLVFQYDSGWLKRKSPVPFIQTYGPSTVVQKLLKIIKKASSRFAGST